VADIPPVFSAEAVVGVYDPFTPVETAASIINSVRDQIPDPVYNDAGEPEPDLDGSFLRAQTLYRWLTNGILEISRMANFLVPDWYALPSVNMGESYTIDSKYVSVEAVWVNQLRCVYLDENWRIYPSSYVGQPLSYSMNRRAGAFDISLYSAPNQTDPVTALTVAMSEANVTQFTVADATGFLSYGWVRIEGELIEYRLVNATTKVVSVLRRGRAGTKARTHEIGAPVTHCSMWLKGQRRPLPVYVSTDIVEIPSVFLAPLELYVLSKVREAEQSRAEAKSLYQDFIQACKDICGDPVWQQLDGTFAVQAYGGWHGGPIYPLGPFGTIVP